MKENNQVPENYNKLKSLIDSEARTEDACREFLKHVPTLLFKETLIKLGSSDCDYRSHSGDSDYVISGITRDTCGIERIRVYVWELKAPQCYIFEEDTKNRVKPSNELIDAENKLLHYYDELKGSQQFLEKFGIAHSDNVCIGGIIIGCNLKLVSGNYSEEEKRMLFARAKRIRDTCLYGSFGIKLMTWDTVLDQFRSIEKVASFSKGKLS